MTEQEAEQLAIKLTRIWVPEGERVRWFLTDGFAFVSRIYGREFKFLKGRLWQIELFNGYEHLSPPHLYCNGQSGYIGSFRAWNEKRASDFENSCLPLFRRNCYLSGAPIECTAHEQLEWHQWLQEREAAPVAA